MIELPICVFVELIISGEIVLLSMTSSFWLIIFPVNFPLCIVQEDPDVIEGDEEETTELTGEELLTREYLATVSADAVVSIGDLVYRFSLFVSVG